MNTYLLIYKDALPYLRLKNPLQDSRQLISSSCYEEHEKLYIEGAMLLLDPVAGKREYLETNIAAGWQFLENDVWLDCNEPSFIDTKPDNYRYVFKVKQTELNYQEKVSEWLLACFGEDVANDKLERCFRFLEEAIELVQSLGCSKEDAYRLITYVYGRPTGDPEQEVGGVMVTLAALCSVSDLRMSENGDKELKRVWGMMDKIREKQVTREIKNSY